MTAESRMEYFHSTGLLQSDPDAALSGKFFTRAQNVLGYVELSKLLSADVRGVTLDYFFHDYQSEQHLITSEQISNTVNGWLLSHAECAQLRDILEENLDHGYNHFRRVEKWFKEIFRKDFLLRNDRDVLYFAPSAYMAIRTHDLIEVYTGKKEYHDAAAALFSLGIVMGAYEKANEAVSTVGFGGSIPSEDWQKIAWGTAFICLHHSRPEKMPPAQEVLARGMLFDPKKLLEEARKMAEDAGFGSLEDFFPPYALISDTIKAVDDGIVTQPEFSEDEIEGLQKMIKTMAAADKLDGLFPADLSAARTVMTRPNREFFTREESGISLQEEFERRVTDGGAHESVCDLNRLLFEISRAKAFEEVSSWLSFVYRYGMRNKASYLSKAIPAFLDGDFRPYLQTYHDLELSTTREILYKSGHPASKITAVLNIGETKARRDLAKRIIREAGYNPQMLDELLYTVSMERQTIAKALEVKHKSLFESGLIEGERQRIRDLLKLAIRTQESQTIEYPGPWKLVIPYASYYALKTEKWRL